MLLCVHISATAPRRDGVLGPLPVRATSFLSYLLYLPTFLPLKGPEIGGPLKPPPLPGHLPDLLKPHQNPSKTSKNQYFSSPDL